ncbi:MAG: hypothetical protein ACE5GL_00145 [Calditrichia bacterium]
MHFTEPRFTKDLDIWVEPTADNAGKVWRALSIFGAPIENVTIEDFQNPDNVYQIGLEPNRIDVLMGIEGSFSFEIAWKNKVETRFNGVKAFIMNINELIKNKAAIGRLQDKLDLERLKDAKKNRMK